MLSGRERALDDRAEDPVCMMEVNGDWTTSRT